MKTDEQNEPLEIEYWNPQLLVNDDYLFML